MWTRAELKEQAKAWLSGKYWYVLVLGLIPFLTSQVTGQLAGMLLSLWVVLVFAFPMGLAIRYLIVQVVEVGVCKYMIRSMRDGEDIGYKGVFSMFNSREHANVAKTMFLRDLFIWLWSLLFYVPGVIKSYEYKMVPYLLADYPEKDSEEIFAMSKEMMQGNKMNAFLLDLSFLGWHIVGFLCCCLGAIFLTPYLEGTYTALYLKLRGENQNLESAAAGSRSASADFAGEAAGRAKALASNLKGSFSKKTSGPAVSEDKATRAMSQNKNGYLIGVQGEFSGANVPIVSGSEIVIGRDPARCQLVVNGAHISRVHVTIAFDGRVFRVTDSSTTGTYDLEKGRLPNGQGVLLPSGTHLQLGTTGDIFKLEVK